MNKYINKYFLCASMAFFCSFCAVKKHDTTIPLGSSQDSLRLLEQVREIIQCQNQYRHIDSLLHQQYKVPTDSILLGGCDKCISYHENSDSTIEVYMMYGYKNELLWNDVFNQNTVYTTGVLVDKYSKTAIYPISNHGAYIVSSVIPCPFKYDTIRRQKIEAQTHYNSSQKR